MPKTTLIRPYNPQDFHDFQGILAHWGDIDPPEPNLLKQQIERAKQHMHGDILLAFDSLEHQLLGYCQMGEHTMVGLDVALEVIALLVHKDYRGQGIGTQLLNAAESWAKEHGYSVIMLSSQLHRQKAHELYRHTGYKDWKQSQFFKKNIV